MDESGSAIDVEQKSKVILSSEEKETFARQDGNKISSLSNYQSEKQKRRNNGLIN